MTISNNLQISQANQLLLCHYSKLPIFQKVAILYCLKNTHTEINDKSKLPNILLSKLYQLLEPTHENIELVPENIQENYAVRLPGNAIHKNWNALVFQNAGNKRPSVVIYKNRLTRFLLSQVSNYLVKLPYHQKVKEISDSILKCIRIRELNSFTTNGKTKMISFPGPTSKEILHYLDVHQTNTFANTIILPAGVNGCWKITVNRKEKT